MRALFECESKSNKRRLQRTWNYQAEEERIKVGLCREDTLSLSL